jgi:starch phosphorylase
VSLFSVIDGAAWEDSHHNPIRLLKAAPASRLDEVAHDAAFIARYDSVMGTYDEYMRPSARTWFGTKYPRSNVLIAYFCAEYGLHESVPIYSGGLGVLAGDHCKAASDLGLPFVALGLWYSQGYFRQLVDETGQQIAAPDHVAQSDVPLQFAGPDGSDIVIEIPYQDRSINARVWRLQVGRVPIYLLDTDVSSNSAPDRAISSRLYGGDRETRIGQEVVLGVGGVRALRALKINPTRWHMNEGHAAFMGLERIREMVQSGINFTAAWPNEAETSIFTTHTPVPAGNEVFRQEVVLKYLPDMAAGMGLDEAGFLRMGNEEGAAAGTFAMTPLAIRLSHRANGVSVLHGAVARSMWAKQFPELSEAQVPITSITNGVHTPTWVAPALGGLLAKYLGSDWLDNVDDPALWEKVADVPDDELWAVHNALKRHLLTSVMHDHGAVPSIGSGLNPNALTIGFARRFATYKRATLFFHDMERAVRILTNPDRPVQIIFAGKAHPSDGGGQALIKAVIGMARTKELAGKVVFMTGYDIALARTLVQGVDVWLNNPERPLEASGTSGQKAALNGIPNLSVRDGWWNEGYNGRNGWAFGGAVGDDDVDSNELYDQLEQSVIPAYFERESDGIPRRWMAVMKASLRTLAPAFSAQRMVKEYTERVYL